jgi:type I restriction-modification system DNA methylase subunit
MVLYNNVSMKVPFEQRSSINNKVLYLIETDSVESNGLSKEDIYNLYTGEGGLHGEEFSKHSSFHSYTKAKQEYEKGQFFTPHGVCSTIVDCIRPKVYDLVGDLTCGRGDFFNHLPSISNVYGCESDKNAVKVAEYLYPDANIEHNDVRHYSLKTRLDLMLINPPYNLRWDSSSLSGSNKLNHVMFT